MSHPYRQQPSRAFWDSAVVGHHPLEIEGWYTKRFDLTGSRSAAAGSCFAQHLGRGLRARGFDFLDVEPAPESLPRALWQDYSYGIYSARYGNIYTARQFVQLFERAMGRLQPVEDYWEKDGGVVDPFRPTLEPEPFGSVEELRALRKDHLDRVVDLFTRADTVVFTMGLTEAWLSKQDGACFPLCPGTSAGGVYDDSLHALHNLTASETRDDMARAFALARELNPKTRFILTVSPVSMMATATHEHVAVASIRSKSVLRAAAGELYDAFDYVDYFPSYEMVNAPFVGGFFHKPTRREIAPAGVDYVMKAFFDQHKGSAPATAAPLGASTDDAPVAAPPMRPRMAPGTAPAMAAMGADDERVKCDEELLSAFAPGADDE